MVIFPNAKINLGLFVTGKRPDGYHNLESCFLPVGVSDILEIIPRHDSDFRLYSSGIPVAGSADSNLVYKARTLLQRSHGIAGVDCYLHKSIPTGAGLGGGSADGTFMIELLDKTFNLQLTFDQKILMAEQLGSDCPFFLHNKPALVTGRGENIEPLAVSLAGFHVLLVKPDIHISTADAFADIKPKSSEMDWKKWAGTPISEWYKTLRNDFEPGIFAKHPMLAKIKEAHYQNGALYAQMSGTGSCVFGIYYRIPLELSGIGKVWQKVIAL